MYESESHADRHNDPALRQYLNWIGRIPLLERDEEIRIARRIRGGDRQALDRMVNANLRFVVSVARRFLGRGLGLMDLIAEGNLGLITAARRFDERRDFRFVTYAVWWIRQSIQTALQNDTRTVRVPANRQRQTQGLQQAVRTIEQKKMGRAREEEVAESLDLSPRVLARVRAASAPAATLDRKAHETAPSLAETLIDPDAETGLEHLERSNLARDLAAALDCVTERERYVLSAYYGLGSAAPRSLDAIGGELRLSRERVRQIRNQAFQRIRQGEQGVRLAQHLAS